MTLIQIEQIIQLQYNVVGKEKKNGYEKLIPLLYPQILFLEFVR